ncbi:Oligopeptide transporter 2 [Cladobotryum mycophilum]|uniref:Oligopeptide transporter 2 n=1 Tax=Cladobotryum mycophilum TaxID=491253 RepID=A0ABR0T3W6_9HYPO
MASPSASTVDERRTFDASSDSQPSDAESHDAGRHLAVTEDDLLEAKELAASYSLEGVRRMMKAVYNRHKHDPNFPTGIITKIDEFINNDEILEQPSRYDALIAEMKIEAALIANNSPYASVRAVVDNHDDPTLPVSTIRVWVIGIVFATAISFLNAFFSIRLPAIAVGSNVVQLLAYPVGKFFEKALPDVGITLFGVRHSLNPGPFNKKEHMLISLMSAICITQPYTNNIVWMQYLPQFFNQKWAASFGYQIMIALSTNFIGDANPAVFGPFKHLWTISRFNFFSIAFGLMFVWFWVPNFLFNGLAVFSWMTWIAPKNKHLTIITGSRHGIGLNPFPTFDWNFVAAQFDPMVLPVFSTLNVFTGAFFFFFVILGVYYTNAYNTAYLPIISNAPYDRFGHPYNVSAVLDARGIIDVGKYKLYSPPYIAASQIIMLFAFFALYTAALTHVLPYHRSDIVLIFKDFINIFRPSKREEAEDDKNIDVHHRLMKAYPEVPEWWYTIILVVSIALGCAAVAHYPTYTTVGVVFYGVILCFIFVVPTGIIYAVTGCEVSLNVLAEFIGGTWAEGNALGMSFFKTYGYITCSHALHFSADLKIAHYLKIPPRFTFWAQMIPTLVSTFVCVAVLQFQMKLENVCTPKAPFQFICPVQTTFFTSAVLWGTVGPRRMWGAHGTYAATLAGFPVGMVVVVFFWALGKYGPKKNFSRSIQPVLMMYGGCLVSPYNLTYIWPAVPVACVSWLYIKARYLSFWSKYNYILSAAFASGLAISALIQFFGLTYQGITLKWWGNEIVVKGEAAHPILRVLAKGQYFGPGPGEFS